MAARTIVKVMETAPAFGRSMQKLSAKKTRTLKKMRGRRSIWYESLKINQAHARVVTVATVPIYALRATGICQTSKKMGTGIR